MDKKVDITFLFLENEKDKLKEVSLLCEVIKLECIVILVIGFEFDILCDSVEGGSKVVVIVYKDF